MRGTDETAQLRTVADWDTGWSGQAVYSERLALVDLLDRVLGGGVVVAGDITLSIAGVDLVAISLRALIASVSALAGSSEAEGTAA